MKVISIKEPFATLIANKVKHIETRSWKTNYRGEIYIHASLSKNNTKRDNYDYYLSLLPDGYEMEYGNIICKANLTDCIYMDENFINSIKQDKTEYNVGHYEIGRYAWIISNVQVLKRKIPAKGKLGIWNFYKK